MSHTIHREQIWYNNFEELINRDNISKIIPNNNFTIEENLNALVRFSVLLSILLCLFTNSINYIVVVLVTLLLTIIIYTYKEDIIIEKLSEKDTTVLPNVNNPFMNVLPNEYLDNPDRKVPPNFLKNRDILNKMELAFDNNLYKDASNIFNKNNSQRQFYTMPVTTIPNKQKEFANWLYQTPTTCKEGNGDQCVANLSSGGPSVTRGPIPQNI